MTTVGQKLDTEKAKVFCYCILYLTLGGMLSDGYMVTVLGLCECASVCVCVCLLPLFLPPHTIRRPTGDTSGFSEYGRIQSVCHHFICQPHVGKTIIVKNECCL